MKSIASIAVVTVLLLPFSATRSAPHPLSPSLYYEMGGGSSFQRPLNDATVSPELGISANVNLPLNCDIWDTKILDIGAYPRLIQDYMEGELDKLGQAIVAQLTALGQGLAVAALQRALPGMYDYSQTLTAQINGRVDVAKRSCEAVVNDINKGINPLDAWKQIGMGVGWRATLAPTDLVIGNGEEYAGDEPTSILEASRDIAQNAASAPLPWFDEPAGGADNPIVIVRDLVTAGYNVFESDAATGASSLTEATSAAGDTVQVQTIGGIATVEKRLGVLFENTEEAVIWANKLVGEQTIYTCVPEGGQCDSRFQPGVGLSVLVEEEVEKLTLEWIALLASDALPSMDQLRSVSSAEVQLTAYVYDALMRFPEQDQNVYIGRLIDDVSLSRAVEKAMAIRRMILVSSESPVVKGYVQAKQESRDITDRIKIEIDDLMWAVETQHKLSSKVSGTIIAYDALRDNVGAGTLTGVSRYGVDSTYTDRPTAPDN